MTPALDVRKRHTRPLPPSHKNKPDRAVVLRLDAAFAFVRTQRTGFGSKQNLNTPNLICAQQAYRLVPGLCTPTQEQIQHRECFTRHSDVCFIFQLPLSYLVSRWAMPPPTPPLTTRHSRSGRQAAMPMPPVHIRRSKEHSGRHGLLDTANAPPGIVGYPSPRRVHPVLSSPSPGVR